MKELIRITGVEYLSGINMFPTPLVRVSLSNGWEIETSNKNITEYFNRFFTFDELMEQINKNM